MSEMIEHKKEYFFSFDRIHKELNHLRSKQYEEYKIFSELDLFCGMYLGHERIGYYDEVEWHRFGITSEALPHMLLLIGDQLECLRVLVYFRDHPRDILGEDVDNKVLREFELNCCQEINQIMTSLKDVKTKGGVERFPNINRIERGYFYMRREIFDLTRWGKGHQIIAAHLPHPIDNDARSDVFRPVYILNNAIAEHDRILYNMQQLSPDILAGEPSSWYDIDDFIKKVHRNLSHAEDRFVMTSEPPIVQALLALALYLYSNLEEDIKLPYRKACEELHYHIMSYIRENFTLNPFLVQQLRNRAVDELEDISPMDFHRVIEIPYVGTFKTKVKTKNTVVENKERESVLGNTQNSSEEQKLNVRNESERVVLLKRVYETLIEKMGENFTGNSQWFYVYKLMAENGIYPNRQYQQFKKDIETADIPNLPDTSTFTRKYKQLRPGSTYPWPIKENGRGDILDDGNRIAGIAKDILGL